MSQRHLLHQVGNGRPLRRGLFQKLLSGRGIEKQIFHQQSRAGGTSHLFPNFFHAAFDHITDTCQRFSRFRQHFYPSHRRNTGQSLTAKAQSQALQKVLHLSDLAGTMPQKSRADLFRLDAAAIIGNTNITNAAFFDLHSDLRSTRVHCVFRQLLHNGSRPLHHFTRRNLIDRGLVQKPNLRHSHPSLHFRNIYNEAL